MSTNAQANIMANVLQYTKTFPQEWEQFKLQMKQVRDNAKNKFGEIEGSDTVERKLHEIPETLYSMLKMSLCEEDWDYYNSLEGSKWFAKRNPLFRSSSDT